MSAKYKSPSFLLPNELNTSANTANDTGINSLYSMKFPGNSYIDTGFDGLNNASAITFSLWAKTPNKTGYMFGATTSSVGWALNLYQATTAFFYPIPGASTNLTFPISSSGITNNEWFNLVIVFDGSQSVNTDKIKIYINGNPISYNTSSTFPSVLPSTYTNTLWLGRTPASVYNFSGQIDEVSIFNRALNDDERAALYDGTGSNIRPSNLMATDLNPLAYYPLGEQAQNSGYPGSATPANNVWQFPNGVLQDYVMDFDVVDDVGDYIDTGDIPLEGIYTISFWINPATSPPAGSLYFLLDKGDGGSNISARVTQSFNDTIRFQIGSSNFSSTDTLTNNSWNNVILIANGSSSKIYINNGTAATGTLTTASNTTQSLLIGTDQGKQSGYYFNGQMSNIVVWNSDQSANIANIYNNGSPQTSYTVTPQNWWKLNADSVYTPSAPNYTTSLDFNGSSDYISVGSNNLGTSLTVSAWVNLSSYGNIVLGGSNTSGSPNSYIFYITTSTQITVANFDGNFLTYTNVPPIDLNKWYHLAVVRNGAAGELFINGQSVNSSTSGFGSSDFYLNYLGGQTPTGYNFEGSISNVAVFNSALSASQISTLFNFGTPETSISFDPTAWWKLDDQNAITDSSGNGNTGTNNGATNSPGGVAVTPSWKIPSALPTPTINYTTALDFNGSSDYVRVDNFSGVSNSFSVSLWFNLGTSALVQRNFLELMNPSTANFNQRIFITNTGTIYISQNSGGGGSAQLSTSGINDGKWHHLYATISSNGSIKVILDNSSTASGLSSQSFSSTPNKVNIGVNFYDPNDPVAKRQYFLGQMSNVAVYNSALTDLQVATLYNSDQPETSISFSPISWWKLDTGGSTITDYAGSNSGTNNGATKVDSNVYTGVIPVNGVSTTLPSTALQQSDLQFDSPYSNYSLSFDGTGDYIDIVNSSAAPTSLQSLGNSNSYSISSWINTTTTDTYSALWFAGKTILEMRNEGTTGIHVPFNLSVSSGKLFFGRTSNYTTSPENYSSTTSVNTGSWVHCIATVDNNTLKFYINGSLDSTHTFTTAIGDCSVGSNTANFFIGSRSTDTGSNDAYFNGKIDETAIFNTELTSAQVLEIYNNGRPKDLTTFSGTAPISWWRLGENAYFNTGTTPGPEFTVPNSIAGAPNGVGSGTVTTMLSADAPGTYANGIGDGLAITDRVGNAPLSVANSQSYNMIPDDKVPYVPGYVGAQIANTSEMTFNGVDSFFNTGNVDLGINSTLSMWFKPGTSPAVNDYALIGEGSNDFDYVIRRLSGSAFYVWVGSSVSYSHNYGSAISTNINANGWNFLAIQKAGDTITVYLKNTNGEFEATATKSVWATTSMTFDRIGSRTTSPPAQVFSGQIDEVAGFSETLTADQIKFDLYEATTTGKTADIENNTNLPTPVAWYRMGD